METLTANAISRINGMQNSEDDISFQPILQIINLRRVNKTNATQERYRVSLFSFSGGHFAKTLAVGMKFI